MPSRLAQCQSLYLQKHADNPVDWWYWCDDAISTARQENRPIFLSIGYSSCHWCTVMEREAFSDEAIAHYLNSHFIPIKVDRDERPDLDSHYMQALQLMIGQRGWPLNIFLTPDDLIPFYAGTYFPIEARYGKPAFLKVLESLHNLYEQDWNKLASITAQVSTALQSSTEPTGMTGLSQALLYQGLIESGKVLIPSVAGTSFPMIPYAQTVLQGSRLVLKTEFDLYQLCQQRSLDLSLGGIFDHVGGGFHRYTVDPTWTVPHFEKMLYDNGLILAFLSEMVVVESRTQKSPALELAIRLTVEWLEREMTAPSGYFYAAQDADSYTEREGEPQEGAFYLWSKTDLTSLLDPTELTALKGVFLIPPGGNFEGLTVLQRQDSSAKHPLSAIVHQGLTTLYRTRYGQDTVDRCRPFPTAANAHVAKTYDWPGRIPPVTDTKLIVAWNALTISGLAKAATALLQPRYLSLAMKAAHFILEHQWIDQRCHRLNYGGQATVLAQAEDYAFFTQALLDIQQACLAFEDYCHQDRDWFNQAVEVQGEQDEWFWSESFGGYRSTAKQGQCASSDGQDEMLGQERSYRDTAMPSVNGVAIANLVRLSLLSENLNYLNRAEQTLNAFSGLMAKETLACPSLFQGLDWFYNGALLKISETLAPKFFEEYLPTIVVAIAPELPSGSVGLICQGTTCLEPAMSWEQMLEQVRSKNASGGI